PTSTVRIRLSQPPHPDGTPVRRRSTTWRTGGCSGRDPGGGRRTSPAMPEPRAQRTLVKSPPELWAEITDVSSLARHLGGFGEIRITRVEAETTVAWEGDRARGTVELAPAGWGTKVTLTAEAVAGAAAPRAAADVADSAPAVEMATDEAAPETTDAAQT